MAGLALGGYHHLDVGAAAIPAPGQGRNDLLYGGPGTDTVRGGGGTDYCEGETLFTCE